RPEDRWQSAAQFRDALDEWLRRTTRASARQLAALLGEVINAPTADLHGHGHGDGAGAGVVAIDDDDAGALSGPMPRVSQAHAEAEAARARAEFISGEAIPSGIGGDIGSSGILQLVQPGDDDLAAEDVEIPSGPREVGDIAQQPVLRVVYLLARGKGTG